ncbi:MAG: SlyX family protein [Pseudomonadota bacterium]
MSTEIEERLAHLERLTDDLNAVVAEQAKTIETLTKRVAMLMEREAAREADGGGGIVFGDETPPHY